MPIVLLIGAGALGKYHLIGLLRSSLPLDITVVDPDPGSLSRAKEAADGERSGGHCVSYMTSMPAADRVDLAIIATTAGHRAQAIESLLKNVREVRFLILEKILFDKKEQYNSMRGTLKDIPTFVNHARRLYPFHRSLKEHAQTPMRFHASGGARYGLMTSVLHYADYFSYLNGSHEFETDTSLLSPEPIPSKRAGYLELFGTLSFSFKNGSWGAVTSLPQEGGLRVSIASPNMRAELFESDGKASLSLRKNGWTWDMHEAPLLRQSDLSGVVAARLLESGACDLPTLEEASRVHLQVLEPVMTFLNEHGHHYDSYPFT